MSYWTKIIISVSSEDRHVRPKLEEILGPLELLEIDSISTLFYADTKRRVLNDFLWELRCWDWVEPESVQVFFQGEDDFKYRTVDIFPEIQQRVDVEERRCPGTHPLYYNMDLVKTLKPKNWDKPEAYCLPNPAGWIKCPGCDRSFKPYDKNVFVASRHSCGQRIVVESEEEC